MSALRAGQCPPFRVRIPATSANLGPGFDLFGLALAIYTELYFEFSEEPQLAELVDADGRPLPFPPEKNLIAVGFRALLQELGYEAPGFRARVVSELPPGRGFGSSAAALAGGVAAARALLHFAQGAPAPLDQARDDVNLLTRLEGHPDNAAPARVGGFVFACLEAGLVRYFQHRLPEALGLAAIVPDFGISTAKSRTQLPRSVSLADCLSNLKGALLWREYIDSGDEQQLVAALNADRLHQPYRSAQIPALAALQERAAELGIFGATISGSGPGLLCYYPRIEEASILSAIKDRLSEVTEQHGQNFQILPTAPDYHGLVQIAAALQA
ncbi:MAG: homoserine kinase [Leptospirales bacterium]|nr:homoserine kinase [Leptospirales bacterium]